MKLVLYDDISKFTGDVMDILAVDEVRNNLIISNCIRGKEGMNTSNWFMAAVKDVGGEIRLIGLMTPPHNLVLYEVNNMPDEEATGFLAKELEYLRVGVPGVFAEKSLADRFASQYVRVTGKKREIFKNLRIYRLDSVNPVSVSPGRMRAAIGDDLYYLPYWNSAFETDCGHPACSIEDSLGRVKKLIDAGTLFVWEDTVPVSQAAMGRRTLNGAVVNSVYTPPHLRGKGYATSCVAGLSRLLLEKGYEFCCLFTDLANPVSNSIYMKMGYKPICDYDEYRLTELQK